MEKRREKIYEAPKIEILELKLTTPLLETSLSSGNFESVEEGEEWN